MGSAAHRHAFVHAFSRQRNRYLRLAVAQAQRGKEFTDDAEKAYRKALECAEAHGMRPLAAECHEGLAKLHEESGDGAAAQKAFKAAAKLYSETGLNHRAKALSGQGSLAR